jgi:hypothetical protein
MLCRYNTSYSLNRTWRPRCKTSDQDKPQVVVDVIYSKCKCGHVSRHLLRLAMIDGCYDMWHFKWQHKQPELALGSPTHQHTYLERQYKCLNGA